jgi:hypothetical protein
MNIVRRLLMTRIGTKATAASIIQAALTATGVFTFIAGTLYLPALSPTRVEMFLVLLMLAAVALLCTAVGQLAAIGEKLNRTQ